MAVSFYSGEGDYTNSIAYTCYSAKASFIEDEFEYLQDIMINVGELTKYTSFVDLVDVSVFNNI